MLDLNYCELLQLKRYYKINLLQKESIHDR